MYLASVVGDLAIGARGTPSVTAAVPRESISTGGEQSAIKVRESDAVAGDTILAGLCRSPDVLQTPQSPLKASCDARANRYVG